MDYIKLNRSIHAYHTANPEKSLLLLPLVHKSYTHPSFMALIFQKVI